MKQYLFIVCLMIASPHLVHSQTKITVAKPDISSPLDRVKAPKAVHEFRRYKKQLKTWKKDSIASIKEKIEAYQNGYDSLSNLSLDSLRSGYQDSLHHRIDSLKELKNNIPWDSLMKAKRRQYQKLLEQQAAEKVKLDELPEGTPENNFTRAMDFGGNLSSQDQLDNPATPQIPNTTELMQNSRQKATKHFDGQQQKLQEAHGTLKKLRKKYSKIENTKTMKGVKKAVSLKGVPFKKRVFTGGNIMVLPGTITILDCAPSVGYKINKVWIAGVKGMIRFELGYKNPYIQRDESKLAGYSIFSEYRVIGSFFVHSSFERLNEVIIDQQNSETRGSRWVENAFLGIGKSYRINDKLKGTFAIKYNFFHKQSDTYPRPWVIDFGFRFNPFQGSK